MSLQKITHTMKNVANVDEEKDITTMKATQPVEEVKTRLIANTLPIVTLADRENMLKRIEKLMTVTTSNILDMITARLIISNNNISRRCVERIRKLITSGTRNIMEM
jgi:uncharacterized membrane protein YqhA